MTLLDTLTGLALALLAMYGLGIPLAWLLPAPDESQWTFRIAVAPLYAIVATSAGAWLLGSWACPCTRRSCWCSWSQFWLCPGAGRDPIGTSDMP